MKLTKRYCEDQFCVCVDLYSDTGDRHFLKMADHWSALAEKLSDDEVNLNVQKQ